MSHRKRGELLLVDLVDSDGVLETTNEMERRQVEVETITGKRKEDEVEAYRLGDSRLVDDIGDDADSDKRSKRRSVDQ